MIDTICIFSPELDFNLVEILKEFCTMRKCVDMGTGNVMYEFINADLKDSFDNRISLRVCNDKWVRNPGEQTASKQLCKNYLRLECSVHKQMICHNIFGGSNDFQLVVKWMVLKLQKITGVLLPDFSKWSVHRVDYAEAYMFDNPSAITEWFRLMKNVHYARREEKSSVHGLSGLYFPGGTTTFKFYHKGPEFRKHDRKKAAGVLSFQHLEQLQRIADSILRVEVEIKIKKLKSDFGGVPLVEDITGDYLKSVYDAEYAKIMKGYGDGMEVARKDSDVEKILFEKYNYGLAQKLHYTWNQLSKHGEAYVKEKMPFSTFKRHKKLILEAGCSWIGSDVVVAESVLPADFQPVRTDRHYFGLVLQEVQDMLNKVA